MLSASRFTRPSWTIKPTEIKNIDLSKNVHFDLKLNYLVKKVIKNKKKFILNYGNEYNLYKSICKYYNLNINNVAIGYGATDILQRIIFSLSAKKLYIVNNSFAMIKIYCKMINLDYELISLKDLKTKKIKKDSAMYIANPNGFDGLCSDISNITNKFKIAIIDEVYADFFPKFSLLNKPQSNLIIVKSLSKSLGVAGLRVGFSYSSSKIAKEIQKLRTSQVTSSIASIVVPEIINHTKDVILRMKEAQKFLQQNYECLNTNTNYVLFKKQNKYTDKFGSRKIGSYHRMALADLKTLKTA